MASCETKIKAIIMASHNDRTKHNDTIRIPSRYTVASCRKTLVIVSQFGFASDWWRKWREFLKPITEHSKENLKQSQVSFDTQLQNHLT